MPVMISPRSARDSLACAVPAAARPTLKCTFSQHGGCLSRLRTSAAAQTRGPRPQVQRSRQKDPSRKIWLSQLGQGRPSRWKRKFSLGGNAVAGLSRSRYPALRLSPRDRVPSDRGVVPSWLDCGVRSLCPPGQPKSPWTFQPPTIVPHFTAVRPLVVMQGTREFDGGHAQPALSHAENQ